jgi:hypothetical protein
MTSAPFDFALSTHQRCKVVASKCHRRNSPQSFRRAVRLFAILIGLLVAPAAARADDDEPSTVSHSYSPYEKASIDEAAARLETKPDPAPEGKIVEGIDVVTLDVIEPRDPAPAALNWLHATTRRYVIEREVLLSVGEKYQRVLCDETARNLRGLPQLSLVICAATQGSSPDRVRVLVITKDVWSLRMGWDVSFIGGKFESLQLVPTESNVAGSHQIVLASFLYQPESRTVGLGYSIPRLGGRRLGLSTGLSLTWNKHGELEGSAGSLGVGKPLYSARTEWAWAIGTSWSDGIARLYRNGELQRDPRSGVLWAYRSRRVAEGANITRSFGWAIKNDFTTGIEMNIREYLPPVEPGADPRAIQQFVNERLPTGETRVGPFVQYRGYTSNFLRVLDFETLGLQEDFRVGHDIWLRFYPISEALGSSRTFLGTYAAAQYTVPMGDGLARLSIDSTMEGDRTKLSDAAVAADLRLVTPRLGFGRLVFDAGALNRYHNYLNRRTFLGGDGRLRGYPSAAFSGKDLMVYNLELRSRPVEIFSCQLGGAAFFDAGGAANGFDQFRIRQSAGVGFRILFPQLDRIIFRGDIGFPLGDRTDPDRAPAKFAPYTIAIAFEQAFSVPGVGGRVGSTTGAGYLGQ